MKISHIPVVPYALGEALPVHHRPKKREGLMTMRGRHPAEAEIKPLDNALTGPV